MVCGVEGWEEPSDREILKLPPGDTCIHTHWNLIKNVIGKLLNNLHLKQLSLNS